LICVQRGNRVNTPGRRKGHAALGQCRPGVPSGGGGSDSDFGNGGNEEAALRRAGTATLIGERGNSKEGHLLLSGSWLTKMGRERIGVVKDEKKG